MLGINKKSVGMGVTPNRIARLSRASFRHGNVYKADSFDVKDINKIEEEEKKKENSALEAQNAKPNSDTLGEQKGFGKKDENNPFNVKEFDLDQNSQEEDTDLEINLDNENVSDSELELELDPCEEQKSPTSSPKQKYIKKNMETYGSDFSFK